MTKWRQIESSWCLWPSKPSALIEMIGGSYLASNPQISYRQLLEGLSNKGLAIHTWGYFPGFDHQSQANHAWKDLRRCKKFLEKRIGKKLVSIRLGHSLGCKLHLLAPDGGRNSKGLISLAFNNFEASRSIPMLKKLAPKLGFHSEFSPSPIETMKLISKFYLQPNNLLICFKDDYLDQSKSLLTCLKGRDKDASKFIYMNGNHLTPASAGIRKSLVGGGYRNSPSIYKNLEDLIEEIHSWSFIP